MAPPSPPAPINIQPVVAEPVVPYQPPATPVPVLSSTPQAHDYAPDKARDMQAEDPGNDQPPDDYYAALDGRESDGDEGDSDLAALPPPAAIMDSHQAAPRLASEIATVAHRQAADNLWQQAYPALALLRHGDENWSLTLGELLPMGLDGDYLKLGFSHELVPNLRDYLQKRETEVALRDGIANACGRPRLRVKVDPVIMDLERQLQAQVGSDARISLFRQVEEHPLVRQVCELFDGKLVDVRNTPPPGGQPNH
jgi:hypothetical protein